MVPTYVSKVGKDDATTKGSKLESSNLKVGIVGPPEEQAEEERDEDSGDAVKVEEVLPREGVLVSWDGLGLVERTSRRVRTKRTKMTTTMLSTRNSQLSVDDPDERSDPTAISKMLCTMPRGDSGQQLVRVSRLRLGRS